MRLTDLLIGIMIGGALLIIVAAGQYIILGTKIQDDPVQMAWLKTIAVALIPIGWFLQRRQSRKSRDASARKQD